MIPAPRHPLCAVVACALVVGCGRVDPRWAAAPARPRAGSSRDGSQARLALGAEHLKSDRLAEAAATFRAALEADPKSTDALLGLAIVAARTGDGGAALVLTEAAWRLDPGNRRVANVAGLALLQADRPAEAAVMLERAIEFAPSDLVLRLNAAMARVRAGDMEAAREHLARATTIAPAASAPRLMGIDLLMLSGRAADAVSASEALVRERPEDHRAREALGRTLRVAGRPHEALAAFVEAERLAPEWPPAAIGAGWSALESGDAEAARERFRRALEIAPSACSARLGLAESLTALGDREGGLRVYEGLLHESPAPATALNNVAWSLISSGDASEEALGLARGAVELGPGHASYLDTLGWGLHRAGRTREGLPYLEEAVRRAPGNRTFAGHLEEASRAASER